MPFRDRRDAGRRLAALLGELRDESPVVVALPRGGVPVGAEVARALAAPLDVLLVRKIGAPGNPEFGVGAIAEAGVRVLSEAAMAAARVAPEHLAATIDRENEELERRRAAYRPGPLVGIAGRTVVLVDDGLATGVTAVAAARALRRLGAGRIVLAVPVAAPESVASLRAEVDAVVAVEQPPHLGGIGAWYDDFSQTTDDEVRALLAASVGRGSAGEPATGGGDVSV